MNRQIKRLQKPRKGIQYIVDALTREELSPFVFFDAGTMNRKDDGLFIGMHPHSGIGIITYFEGANLVHDDSGKNDQIIRDGGVQWIRAGGGVWHQEKYQRKAETQGEEWALTIHQLWLQLPPELEESEVEYQNLQPETLPQLDGVKVVAGTYRGQTSPLKVPFAMTYLDIELKAGETFRWDTPHGQSKGFIFPRLGEASLQGQLLPQGNLSILEEGEGLIEIQATSDAALVLLCAAPQDYPIVSRRASIHTNSEALDRSLLRIQQIGQSMAKS